jgi:hypothetical protein
MHLSVTYNKIKIKAMWLVEILYLGNQVHVIVAVSSAAVSSAFPDFKTDICWDMKNCLFK